MRLTKEREQEIREKYLDFEWPDHYNAQELLDELVALKADVRDLKSKKSEISRQYKERESSFAQERDFLNKQIKSIKSRFKQHDHCSDKECYRDIADKSKENEYKFEEKIRFWKNEVAKMRDEISIQQSIFKSRLGTEFQFQQSLLIEKETLQKENDKLKNILERRKSKSEKLKEKNDKLESLVFGIV